MGQVMNRSENSIYIAPRVDRLEDGTYVTLVRQIVLVNNLIAHKVLSSTRYWINVSGDEPYPKEHFLKSSTIDRRLMDNRLYNWPSSEGRLMNGLVMYPQQIELK